MKLAEIKQRMKEYRDFYGGDLLNVDDIDECNTESELKAIIDKHSAHIEMMLRDAESSLERLKRELF